MKKFFLLLFAVLLVTGCAPGNSGAGSDNTVVVAGSTTVTPVMRELASAFEASNGVSIEVQELGTSAGINATISGVSNIAMASRAITQAETEQGLSAIAIAIDGVAVIVNASNPVDNLSLEQITAVFRGEITNWSELGGNDAPITVVSREEGSGIRQTFETFAGLQDEIDEGVMGNLSEQAQMFVDFILSENGQNIVSEAGYVRVQ
jgi:phosphate transport system substrate-binding protein